MEGDSGGVTLGVSADAVYLVDGFEGLYDVFSVPGRTVQGK